MKSKTVISIILFLLFSVFFNEINAQQGTKHHAKKNVRYHTGKKRGNYQHKKNNKPGKLRRTAHYKYRHLPRRGTVVASFGYGYVNIKFKHINYHFHKGVFYKPTGSQFIVARAPIGIRVRILPVGYRKIFIRNRPYFYYYGTYYCETENSEEFEVVEAPLGAEIDAIPEGYETLTFDDIEYYLLDDVYYEPGVNEEGEEYYRVVPEPTQENANEK
ncbi:MAG: DUF6515 family protein [Bacteroidales bacterium]|nr:DUF6515 family protein [Bacteroidales bacterium]